MRKALLICWLITCVCFSAAQAAQVTLACDANSPTPQGYRLYQRTASSAYNYATPVWSGAGTMATVTGLADGAPYYFVARAYQGTAESGNSNEVLFVSATPTPVPTPTPAPTPTPDPTATPTPPPTPTPPKCWPISGSGGFVDSIYPGEFRIEDGGKLWVVTIAEPAPAIEYSGNMVTGTFHKTGCRYFGCLTCTLRFKNREEAISQGFKPCGICKP